MQDTSRYEILFDSPAGEYEQTEVGGIRTKTIRAGDSLEVEAFPITRITQDATRERWRRRSSPAQEALNSRNAVKRIRRLAEANFTGRDMFVTLTMDYGFEDYAFTSPEEKLRQLRERGFPEDVDEARRMIVNFFRKVKRRMAKAGQDPRELKYIYVIESSKEPRDTDLFSTMHELPPRFHFHLLMHAPGIGRDEIETLWGYGYAQTKRLDFRDNGLAGLTKYITKQRKFTRRWARSRNLTEPTVTVSDRRISRARARRTAEDVQANARAVFEAVYPGYALEEATVRFSDFIAGAYIYARLRRRTDTGRRDAT